MFRCSVCKKEWQTLGRYENHIDHVHNGDISLQGDTDDYSHMPVETDPTHVYLPDDTLQFFPSYSDSGANFDEGSIYSDTSDTNGNPTVMGIGVDFEDDEQLDSETVRCEYASDCAGMAYQPRLPYDPLPRNTDGVINYWFPFQNAFDFKMARQLIHNSKTYIEKSFTTGLLPSRRLSFRSAEALYKKIEIMGDELGSASWSTGYVTFADGSQASFKYRDPVFLARHLLKQYAYKDHLVYAPVKEYRGENRLYSELHTADWWWEMQAGLLDANGTVIPIILGSDATHLTQFSGGKKAWPVYMTIGNLKSTIRNKSSYSTIALLALLPVAASSTLNRDVGHKMLSTILEPLNRHKQGVVLTCADGADRLCIFRLAGWIADHMEYCYLFHIKTNACPVCEVKLVDLGSNQLSRTRDYMRYKWMLVSGNLNELKNVDVHPVESSVMWAVDEVMVTDLWKPDILHVILLGVFKHVLEWVEAFMKEYGRMDTFNICWKSFESYPNVRMPQKAYKEISQWQGSEMRTFSRIILPCLAVALDKPNPPQRLLFKKVFRCVSAIVDFSLLASYQSHDEETIGYLENYLKEFHAHKNVFLKYRAGKEASKAADLARKDLLTGLGEREDLATLTSKQRKQRASDNRNLAEEERNSVLCELAHFNFPKLHLLSHFSNVIRRFGTLPMWSTECTEMAHKEQIKKGYHASNHGITYEEQIIKHYLRVQTINIRELNLKALACDGFYGEGSADVLDLLDDRTRRLRNIANRQGNEKVVEQIQQFKPSIKNTAELSKRLLCSIVKSGFDGSKLQSVADLEELYDIPDLSLYIKIYFASLAKRNLPVPPTDMDIIKKLPVEVFKKIQIPLSRIHEGVDVHSVYATGPFTFHGINRSDWVWYQPDLSDNTRYGILHGRLPARPLVLFIASCIFYFICF
jgi:hypothetical protein